MLGSWIFSDVVRMFLFNDYQMKIPNMMDAFIYFYIINDG